MRRLSRSINAALSPIYVQQRCWAEAASISAPLMSHKHAFLLPSSRHWQIIVDTKTRGYSSDHTRQGPAPTMPSLHSTPGTEHAASSPPPATTSQERDITRDLPPPERVHAEAAPQQHWLDRRAPSVRQWLQSKSLGWWLRGVQARCRYAMRISQVLVYAMWGLYVEDACQLLTTRETPRVCQLPGAWTTRWN